MKRAFASVTLLMCCFACNSATVIQRTVRPSGDGGDYTTLNGWESGRQSDLTASDTIEMAVIGGSWSSADTTAVAISAWTTDATRYIVITNSTSKHDGKRYGSSSTAYKLEVTDNHPIYVNEEFVRIHGLQLKGKDLTADRGGIYINSGTYPSKFIFGDCIITSSSVANGAALFAIWPGNVENNIFAYNILAHGNLSQDSADGRFVRNAGTNFFYNCTDVGSHSGFYFTSGRMYISNCLSQGSVSTSGFSTATAGDYNCTDRASGDNIGASSVSSYNVAFVNETAGSEDYHIQSSNTSIIDVTSDQSGGLFTTDIDGETRSGSWDIGADEYVAASTAVSPWLYGRHFFNTGQ